MPFPPGKVRCNWCKHRCIIAPGNTGICGNNMNIGGRLMNMVYGEPIAMHVDPIEKKPLYHFLPGTNAFSIGTTGCNFKCKHCQNWEISQARPLNARTHQMPPEKAVEAAIGNGCKSIAYTYNEPTVFLDYALDTAKIAKKAGLKNVFVTNGYSTPEAIKAASKCIDAANIDLKGGPKFYRDVVGANYDLVLDSIREYWKSKVFIEITTLVIPGHNDNKDSVKEMADFIKGMSPEIPWHFSAFHPDYKMQDTPMTDPETIFRMCDMATDEGINHVYAGNIHKMEYNDTKCPECGETLIKRMGYYVEVKAEGLCPKCNRRLNAVFV